MSTDTSVFPSAFDTEKFFLPAINNLSTKLISYVAPTQHSIINVESTVGWPDEGIISIDEEIIYYRSKTSNSFKNITRGYDGTKSFQHNSGSIVDLRWVAGHHNRLVNSIKAIERALGINPQGNYPDLSSRLSVLSTSLNRKTSQILRKHDKTTPTAVGYNARMFVNQETFVDRVNYHPTVYVNGLVQIQDNPSIKVTANISSITVSTGIINCVGSNFLSTVSVGDVVVLKGTPSNDDAYIVLQINSNTQLKVNQVIYGTDVIVNPVGTVTVLAPFEGVVSLFNDTIIFKDILNNTNKIRIDYEVPNNIVTTYQNPVAVLSEFQELIFTGNILANNFSSFILDLSKTRGLITKSKLLSTTIPESTHVNIEIFGKSDLTERQYLAEYIDLTLGEWCDNGVWHFNNKENLTHLNIKITNLTSQSFNFKYTVEAEAFGINA